MLKTEAAVTFYHVHQESLRPEKFPTLRISLKSDLHSHLSLIVMMQEALAILQTWGLDLATSPLAQPLLAEGGWTKHRGSLWAWLHPPSLLW